MFIPFIIISFVFSSLFDFMVLAQYHSLVDYIRFGMMVARILLANAIVFSTQTNEFGNGLIGKA